jgi:hypothetical protein
MKADAIMEALVVVAIIIAAIAGGVIGWFVSSLMKRDLLDEGEITRIYEEWDDIWGPNPYAKTPDSNDAHIDVAHVFLDIKEPVAPTNRPK